MILGNLLRMKGQVGRAINIHQALLQRPDLTTLEHAYVLLCLGLDFRHGGFVDRAFEAFQDVVRLDPRNRYALVNLQKLHEEQHQWADAARVREQHRSRSTATTAADGPPHPRLPAQRDRRARRLEANPAAAAEAFRAAIDTDAQTAPAYLNLGDVFERQGDTAAAVRELGAADARAARARPSGLRSPRAAPTRASGAPARFVELCERLIAAQPQDWRARLALSRHLAAAAQHRRAFELLLDALGHHPARHRHPPGDVAHAVGARLRRAAGARLHRPHARRGVLSRSARVHALPLSQHRAAVAVPAVPRVEYIRRRAADAGAAGRRGTGPDRGGLTTKDSQMKRIALTGGMGTGKSHVRAVFAALGVPTIDADTLARDVVAHGTPGFDAVVAQFGRGILTADGDLDRRALAALVFADIGKRRELEAILHPAITRAPSTSGSLARSRTRSRSPSPTSRCSTRWASTRSTTR